MTRELDLSSRPDINHRNHLNTPRQETYTVLKPYSTYNNNHLCSSVQAAQSIQAKQLKNNNTRPPGQNAERSRTAKGMGLRCGGAAAKGTYMFRHLAVTAHHFYSSSHESFPEPNFLLLFESERATWLCSIPLRIT